MNATLQRTDHVRQIIFQLGTVGTGTEGDTIMRAVYHLHHTQDIFLINNDTGQTKDAPGEHRHEIIADQMNIFFYEIFQSLNIVVDVEIPVGSPCFDGIMHVDAFDTGDVKTDSGYFRFQCSDTLSAPDFAGAGLSMMKCCLHVGRRAYPQNILGRWCSKHCFAAAATSSFPARIKTLKSMLPSHRLWD